MVNYCKKIIIFIAMHILLIEDLKPLLSDERKKKADEAVRFLHLMEILPL